MSNPSSSRYMDILNSPSQAAKNDIDNLAKENSKLVKAKRQLENARNNSIDNNNRKVLFTPENTQLRNELKDMKQQLKRYENENNELQTKLQESKSKNEELKIKIQENKIREREELKSTINDLVVIQELYAMLGKFEGIKAKLCKDRKELRQKLDDARQQLKVLQNENKELKNKNKEASTVNTQGIKGQVNYTSTSFILFGVCTVGVNLTIPYLAACIILAIAASTFLVAGLYCLYKVNTALSDVETDQQNKPLLESSI